MQNSSIEPDNDVKISRRQDNSWRIEVISIAIIILLIVIFLLGVTNFIVFKVSGRNRNKRILSGVLVLLLLTPIVFFSTYAVINPFDSGGFGTGIFTVLNSFLFFVNGLIIIIIGVFTKGKAK